MKAVLGFVRYLYWARRLQKGKKWNSLSYSEKADFAKRLCSSVEGEEAISNDRED